MLNNVIWSNEDLDYERDWKDDMEAEYPDMTDDERELLMYELNDEYLGDERMNLNVPVAGKIAVLGDLGLWDGRRMAVKFVDVKTIGDLLDCGSYDYVTWYVDENGDLVRKGVHHDGVNYETFVEMLPDVDEDDVLAAMIGSRESGHKPTRDAVTKLTKKLGRRIAEVYGWNLAV